jgi:hypothetical protein
MRSVIQYGSSSIQYRRRSSSEVAGHFCPEPLQFSSTNCWPVISLSLAPGTREPVYRFPERRREVRLRHRSVGQTGFQSWRMSLPGNRPFSLPQTLGLNWPSPEVQRESAVGREIPAVVAPLHSQGHRTDPGETCRSARQLPGRRAVLKMQVVWGEGIRPSIPSSSGGHVGF